MPQYTTSSFSWLDKPTDLKGQHTFTLFYFVDYVVDPATFLASHSVLATFIFLWELLIYTGTGEKNIHLNIYNINEIKIQSLH